MWCDNIYFKNLLLGITGQQQIQLITAGKPFQSPQIATQQMQLATNAQGKQVLQTTGSAGGFSGTTYTLPGIPSSQPQTLVLSPFNVIGSQTQQQQQSLMTSMNQSNAGKPMGQADNIQKQYVTPKMHMQKQQNTTLGQVNVSSASSIQQNTTQTNSNQQCVQVSQTMPTAQLISSLQQPNQAMQFTAPWLQGMPLWTANSFPSQLLQPNSILIRGTNPDGTQGMFIQQAPQQTSQQTIQTQPQNRKFVALTQAA